MLEDRIRYAIDNFIDEGYFLQMSNEYVLHENAESGESQLHVIVNADNICVEAFDYKKRCAFLSEYSGMKKCVDHLLLFKCEDTWRLCMIEMKTTLNKSKWIDIKRKVLPSYFNAMSLCLVLGIELKMADVQVITTYEKEELSDRNSPNTAQYKASLGKKSKDYYEEFNNNRIKIKFNHNDYQEFPHTAVRMERNDHSVLIGEYILDC